MYDVFLSYPHARASEATAVAAALRTRGLEVWVDESEIRTFTSISRSIVEGLAASKALVAYYAVEYSRSRACQWELTAAFLAAAREGDARRRVLVINPEPSAAHIQPIELRDALFFAAPALGDPETAHEVAASVHAHVDGLADTFGAIEPLDQPAWYGARPAGSSRFVGRLTDFWRLHSALHGQELPIISGVAGTSLALVQGMGGIGKSLLAAEYAVRFAAAYPGGVFWLRAFGNDDAGAGQSSDALDAERGRQIRSFASALGLPHEGRPLDELLGHLGRELGTREKPFLWVVDDMPHGVDRDSLFKWLAPHPLGRTLLTTRSREYSALGSDVSLKALTSDEAYELLITAPDRRKPADNAEEKAARQIVERLGCHPLAVEVAAAALKWQSHVEFLARLDDPTYDELDLALDLRGMLPTGHEPAVATTLLRSLARLDSAGWDFMRLAATLASAPIPVKLVDAVFAAADGLNAGAARRTALRAVHQAEQLSLLEASDDAPGIASVHPLIARTVRFRDAELKRRAALRGAATVALTQLLPVRAEDSHEHLDLLVAHARELAEPIDDVASAALGEWVAALDFLLGSYASAEALWLQILEIRKRLKGEAHPDTLHVMNNVAEAKRLRGDFSGARQMLESFLHMSRRVLGDTHGYTLTALNNLALTMQMAGDLRGAESLLREALHQLQAQANRQDDTLKVMLNLAETLRVQGDVARARGLLEQLRETSVRTHGERHPISLLAANNLALALHAQGELSAARALQERVAEIYRETWGDAHPDVLRAQANLAFTLSSQGDLTAARAIEERVVGGYEQRLGAEHPDTLTAMNNLAKTLREQGDLEAARALLQRVLDASRRVLGDAHFRTSSTAWNMFILAVQMNDGEAARAVLQRDLLYLVHCDPRSLEANQQAIRAEIIALLPRRTWVSRVRGWLRTLSARYTRR